MSMTESRNEGAELNKLKLESTVGRLGVNDD